MDPTRQFLQVAVPSPLYRTFDYLPPRGCETQRVAAGMRVRVPFGRTTRIGIVMHVSRESRIAPAQLKPADELLDEAPLLPAEVLALLNWASRYYHHPLGEAVASAVPALLRHGHPPRRRPACLWQLTDAGAALDLALLARAPRQRDLLQLLQRHPAGLAPETLRENGGTQALLRTLLVKGWVRAQQRPAESETTAPAAPPALNDSQARAAQAIDAARGAFQAFLLDGVTGSGKTEVYFSVIERIVDAGGQALVLVPEIGLTPQLVARFRRRFRQPVAVLHSGRSGQERLAAWLQAKEGGAAVVIGTRSAVFTPLARPGILIVDEEHDPSYKQQEGFRYHARDVAVVRAQRLGIPVVLGSATPSLESLHNCDQGRYQRLVLGERAGAAAAPVVGLLDIRHARLVHGLSRELIAAIRRHLAEHNQVLLFLNRRGYAPTLICHECGWVGRCARCDAHLVLHRRRRLLRCHHCDAQQELPAHCPECAATDLHALGQGTERVEEALLQHFPQAETIRIDRDSTRRAQALHHLLERVQEGRDQILLGTQMLAKGHDFPNVTLVGVLDADHGLFGADFRAAERMGQLITQVAGRAGRGGKRGEVLIQTRHPDHPTLRELLGGHYQNFARGLLAERGLAQLPPYAWLALLRAEAVAPQRPLEYLTAVRARLAPAAAEIRVLGPAPAPMERRAGRYRAQLLLLASGRAALHRALDALIPHLAELPLAKTVRWSLDVDPIDMN